MSEGNDNKSSWKQLLDWALNSTWFQWKTQLADNIKKNKFLFNFNLFGKTIIINQELPPDTNRESVSEMLGQMAPKESPKPTDFQLPPDKDLSWVREQLEAAVNSTATTLTTMANTISLAPSKAPPPDDEDERI
jgi:hypothetical protein